MIKLMADQEVYDMEGNLYQIEEGDILEERVVYKKSNTRNPDPATIDILYHATSYASSIWVSKRNKLSTTKHGHQQIKDVISLSTNIKYYQKQYPPIIGRPIVLWVLDYHTLKQDKIPLQLNTSSLRNVDNWEVLIRDKILPKFTRYVLRTYIGEDVIQQYYDWIMDKNVNLFKAHPEQWYDDVTIKDVLSNYDLETVPKDFEEFRDDYIKKIEKRFGKVTLVDSIKNLKGNA